MPPGNQMKMKMEDRLFGGLSSGRDEVHSLGPKCIRYRAPYLYDSFHQFCIERRFDLPKVAHMNPWDNERVTRRCGVRRKERKPCFALAYSFHRAILTSGDPAEVAIGI